MIVTGQFIDILKRRIYPAEIHVDHGKITSIKEVPHSGIPEPYILPGFIDAHVHIESSMLIPAEFARLAVVHGTVSTVSDPHEIANVCGVSGVEFMIENGNTVPFKFNFGAPSCVPATPFETAGAVLNPADVETLLLRDDVRYLTEMMNFPGVLHRDEEVLKKIASARKLGKPVDGHAPGLRGEQAKQYIDAGISTDHECFTAEEALDKLNYGMKILIREGSAAKNFDALVDLLHDHADNMMFCSDDKHPDSLVEGHINVLCARAVAKGVDVFKVLQAACINPVLHYKLPVGLLRIHDPADFILIEDLKNFTVRETWINGQRVASNGKSLIKTERSTKPINNFSCSEKNVTDFAVLWKGEKEIPVIEALDGQLITNKRSMPPRVVDNKIVTDVEKDILKIAVINRYQNALVATAFIKNFGLKKGAMASSVAHDSHNIVVVGVDDDSITRAVNLVIGNKGGVSCISDTRELLLALPVAGLMSAEDGYEVAKAYTTIDALAKSLGSALSAPFMTLSFMALLVIPHIKISDRGLFDGDEFRFV